MNEINRKRPSVLQVENLDVCYPVRRSFFPWIETVYFKAVDNISFDLTPGETLGVVGESGCGKSSLARSIIGLTRASAGKILWRGQDLTKLPRKGWRAVHQKIQMIFQDPISSLNPRMTIGECISEPLRNFYPDLSSVEIKESVGRVMDATGLLPNVINRYPHEFSGGQCQRVGIARALIVDPEIIICDEPVSALDVSIQAQIINLLVSVQEKRNLSLLFITHDLSVVNHISDNILVMRSGRQVESAEAQSLYKAPEHPYTRSLLAAIPALDSQFILKQINDEGQV